MTDCNISFSEVQKRRIRHVSRHSRSRRLLVHESTRRRRDRHRGAGGRGRRRSDGADH